MLVCKFPSAGTLFSPLRTDAKPQPTNPTFGCWTWAMIMVLFRSIAAVPLSIARHCLGVTLHINWILLPLWLWYRIYFAKPPPTIRPSVIHNGASLMTIPISPISHDKLSSIDSLKVKLVPNMKPLFGNSSNERSPCEDSLHVNDKGSLHVNDKGSMRWSWAS